MALVELRLHGLAVFDSARLGLGPGLSVLTGETGSGKSMCIAGLRLALGGRADGELVRRGAERASVAAVFDAVPVGVRAHLAVNGIRDDELLTLSRELLPAGRSVARVNGALVSQSTLRAIGEELVELTAQGESHRLRRPARQRELLDAAGDPGHAACRRTVAEAVAAWRNAATALEHARAQLSTSAEALARARELVADLGILDLRAGEEAELGARRTRLRHAAALRAAAGALHAAASAEEVGAADALAAGALPALGLSGIDCSLDEAAACAAELVERIRDLGARARDLEAGIEVDEEQLATVEQRLAVLDRVRRRHGSVEAALEALASATDLLGGAVTGPEALHALERRVEEAATAAGEAAAQLSRRRAATARRLEREVTALLRRLRLPAGRLRVMLSTAPDPAGVPVGGARLACGPDGVDTVELRFTASADGVPLPLESVSGGELSRIALALRAVVSAADDDVALVLDEVDTGLGGETAARVGDVLAAIGRRRQVVVVTHRAEIAARASRHLRVVRSDGSGPPTAEIDELVAERPAEVARLMSGAVTEAALARAVELLAEGRAAAPDAATMARG